MERKEILEQAAKCVCTDRNAQYGDPEDNFRQIGAYWATYLKARCVDGDADVTINPEDVAMMMVLFKVARFSGDNPGADTFVDIAGYAACGGEIATAGRGESPMDVEAVEESGDTYLDAACRAYPAWGEEEIEKNNCPHQIFEMKKIPEECEDGADPGECAVCWRHKYHREVVR